MHVRGPEVILRRALVALAIGAAATAIWVVGTLAADATKPSPFVGALDPSQVMVSAPVDVTNGPNVPGSHPQVGRDEAIKIAADYIGATESPLQLVQALAPRIAAEPPRSVWIVVFKAYGSVYVGPAGQQQLWQPIANGVLVDDQTGEVLRGFEY